MQYHDKKVVNMPRIHKTALLVVSAACVGASDRILATDVNHEVFETRFTSAARDAVRNDPEPVTPTRLGADGQWVHRMKFGREEWVVHPPPEFLTSLIDDAQMAGCIAQMEAEKSQFCKFESAGSFSVSVFANGNVQMDISPEMFKRTPLTMRDPRQDVKP